MQFFSNYYAKLIRIKEIKEINFIFQKKIKLKLLKIDIRIRYSSAETGFDIPVF